jgi:SAM-dependent methyltransferase
MAEEVDPATSGYVFDQDAVDRTRLNIVSAWLNQLTAEACARAGLGPGQRAIDVGCGHLGALQVLSEAVGSSGILIGIDASASALVAARESVARLGLDSVKLLQGDINTLDSAALAEWLPFDIAVCRLLLTHQRDPAATLRRVAELVRPGGRIIAQDPLRDDGFPRIDPPLAARQRITELDIAHLRHRGLAHDVAWEYGELCRAAGLRLLEWRGSVSFTLGDTTVLEFARRLLPAQRTGLVGAGLTADDEIDALGAEVDAAIARGVRRSSTAVLVDLIAEVP